MAINLLRSSQTLSSHKARSFVRAPAAEESRALLGELANAPCPFAPVVADRPLALYGAGDLGRLARDFLRVVGQDFVLVMDRAADRMAGNPHWIDARLLHPDAVPASIRRGVRAVVCVVSLPYVPLERSLFDLGFADVVPFYDLAESFRHLHPLSNGWFARPFSADDQDNTVKVLARWDDDVSRAHHLQFLAWRRLREEWTFDDAPMPHGHRFFIPEIVSVLRHNEMIFDGGAHHGSVIETLIRQTNGAFRQITAIEPDPANRAVLKGRLQALLPSDRRVTILGCALARDKGEATFHEGLGYASQLSKTGRMRVNVRPIDSLGLSPSFIKLHLEGIELAALMGARQTLLTCRPIVVATVYHNDDGIWRTPLWLMDALSDYRFLFRVHSWCGTGAVIYAIPNERIRA